MAHWRTNAKGSIRQRVVGHHIFAAAQRIFARDSYRIAGTSLCRRIGTRAQSRLRANLSAPAQNMRQSARWRQKMPRAWGSHFTDDSQAYVPRPRVSRKRSTQGAGEPQWQHTTQANEQTLTSTHQRCEAGASQRPKLLPRASTVTDIIQQHSHMHPAHTLVRDDVT